MTTTPSLSNRVAIVTGASRGIGAATAAAFANAGAAVVLAARSQDALAALATRITTEGGTAVAVTTDVRDETSTQRLVDQTIERFGRLDYAVNSAAAHSQPLTPLADVDVEAFDDTLAVSVRGLFVSLKYQIPAMLQTGGGAIVNIASTASFHSVGGLAGYVAAKHAVAGLTRTAALDYAAQGIRVNALAPGPIHTEQLERAGEQVRQRAAQALPMGRLGQPQEVAAAALWLCSDQASFITGATIPIDGGLLAGTRSFSRPRRDEQGQADAAVEEPA
jgi:NAD(P)-dependent dehydrogenase (short-subunit alcohol dehydrogenase family)